MTDPDGSIEDVEPANAARLYSAPRTFDFATVLVITAAYALLFAALRALGVPLLAVAIIAGFFTAVAISQAVLYGGVKPRLASSIAGAGYIACTLLSLFSFSDVPPVPIDVLTSLVILGALFGYLAGALVGGVFLAAERIREVSSQRAVAEPGSAEDERWQ